MTSKFLRPLFSPLASFLVIASLSAADATSAEGKADDNSRAAENGIRKLSGKHLKLYTDVPLDAEIESLPAVFDAAFDEWCRVFEVTARDTKWEITGCLMRRRETFEAAGLVPANLPKFPNGYSLQYKLWLFEQTSSYYRRHLLLHEGTHCFMATMFDDLGPPWYAEGMAELLATHRLEGRKITLGYFPRSREEVPKLSRVEIIQRDVERGRWQSLADVVAYNREAHLHNEAYGWCWGVAAFLNGHPRYAERFGRLKRALGQVDFNARFEHAYARDWKRLEEEWEIFEANVDYGYGFARMAVEFADGQPLPAKGSDVSVATDRGWQSSKIRLEAGKTYRLKASGRYQVVSQPRVWWCEPGGVTIAYYHGWPLGVLLAAVRPDSPRDQAPSALARPLVAGLERTLQPSETGTLYLRINDAAGHLSDNRGSLTVHVRAQ